MNNRNHGIFVTGTDTGVGKTVVAAGIAAAMKKRGINIGVMKPVHTGCRVIKGKLRPDDSIILENAASSGDPADLITPFMFREPASPLTAAKQTDTLIDINRITECFCKLRRMHDYMIVEGIGGVLVPVSRDFSVADLIRRFKLPVLLVTGPYLGSVNHTMLSLFCLKAMKIPVRGIVINNCKKGGGTLAEKTFADSISDLSGISVTGTLPYIPGVEKRLVSGTIKLPDHFLKLADSLLDI